MIAKPEHFIIVASKAEANHTLTAFDAALLKAGLGNVNLVRLSSILPPGCKEEKNGIDFPPGLSSLRLTGPSAAKKKES